MRDRTPKQCGATTKNTNQVACAQRLKVDECREGSTLGPLSQTDGQIKLLQKQTETKGKQCRMQCNRYEGLREHHRQCSV
jgi:hypothetical protein